MEAVATHSLASPADLERLAREGIAQLRATDSTANPVATIPLAEVLGQAVRNQGWLE